MTPTLEARIETRGPADFATLAPQFESMNLISQNQKERIHNEGLRNVGLYTGDGAAYGLQGQDVFLYITDFANNPLAKDPQEASRQLRSNHNFSVDKTTASGLEAKASASDGVVA